MGKLTELKKKRKSLTRKWRQGKIRWETYREGLERIEDEALAE